MANSEHQNASDGSPVISVVVAAWNEENHIGLCLRALAQQDFDRPYEIIVVDNSSTDRTLEICRESKCSVFIEPRLGQVFAKAHGLRVARAPIVAILDADCVPGPSWISELVKALSPSEIPPPSAVTYFYDYTALPLWGEIFVRSTRLLVKTSLRLLRRDLPFVIGGNVAFRRDHVQEFGGYPTRGGIAATELGLGRMLSKVGSIQLVESVRVSSSARRFHSGVLAFFVDYKIREYLLPYLRRRHEYRTNNP